MFNSGMGLVRGKSSWTPTIETLAKNGVPTLCTSFLKRESQEDEEVLMKNQCNIVIKRHKNPWRSELVTKMLYTRKGYFTYNGFVQGFRGRREREGSSAWDDSYESSITEGQVLGFIKMLQR